MPSQNINRMYKEKTGMLLLHALPLDGSMWAKQMNLLPGSTYAPTLYGFGGSIEEWAAEALKQVDEDQLIVVGCSVGGSCALEIAAAAPERIAALVLIGTKARHRADPVLFASALELINCKGLDAAWEKYWAPLFSGSSDKAALEAAREMAMEQSPEAIACGVSVFHTRASHDLLISKCQVPVIVVTGEDDLAPGLAASSALAASAPRGQLFVIRSCGHYVPIEQPEALNAILADIIQKQLLHSPSSRT